MTPAAPPTTDSIAELLFWRLVAELERVCDGVSVPLPMLRAFVELGIKQAMESAPDEIAELHIKLSELRGKLAALEASWEEALQQRTVELASRVKFLEKQAAHIKGARTRRQAVWQSRVLARHDGYKGGFNLSEDVRQLQARQIEETLRAGLTIAETARELGISTATLYRKFPRPASFINERVAA